MNRRVVITGIGVVSGLGIGTESYVEGLFGRRSAFCGRVFEGNSQFPALPPLYGAHIQEFSAVPFLGRKGLRTLSYESQIFMSAAVMAYQQAGLDLATWDRSDLGVFAGTTFAGFDDYVQFFADSVLEGVDRVNPSQGPQTGFNAPASQLSIRLGAGGPNVTVSSGVASGLDALAYAADFIRSERAQMIVAGAIDTLSYPVARALLSASGDGQPRPFDAARDRPVFGEAGVVFVLEEATSARARGATILAEMTGEGRALADDLTDSCVAATSEALSVAEVDLEELAGVFASASGHRAADAAEAQALAETIGDATPVTAIKGATGECFAASGALQVAAALHSLSSGSLPPTIGFDTPDPDLPNLRICRAATAIGCGPILVQSLDPAGHAAALVLRSTHTTQDVYS